ncbi:electron transfer flavoprotein subunit beta [Pseudomonas sp. PB103]|uniref:phage tail terminator-like protein n=1 Tax=Pseudomonas sp. PB103 TaxID=2494698 RepID=UPI00131AD9E1|nr:phage tail terminator-like protein [Pseudomonas sp. PB103]KAE9642378.1 electron transfer flavoprotein subunit beta [Pseudomonas sp. PB103]
MTFEQIRNIVITRMTQWTGIPAANVDYPNPPKPFDPAGKAIWARLADVPGLSSAPEIGLTPCVRRTGIIIIQLFVKTYTGTLAITKAADTLVQHFQFFSQDGFDCFAVSTNTVGDDGLGWYQVNIQVPYRAS